MRFGEAPSAIPFAPHRSAARLDPYWDGVWQFGAHAQWVTREHSERLEAAGIAARRPRHLRTDPVVAAGRVDADWDAKLNLLGVLSSWRTVTAEQAAAFTNQGTSSAAAARVVGDLFALDVVDTGAIWTPGGAGAEASRAMMLRPSASPVFDRLLRPRMSYAEWVSVTGGMRFLTGGQYDRHNVLTAELALRAAEFLPVGTVLGERQSQVNTLAYTSVGVPEPPGRSQQTADAVLVRPDGLRIAVEMTASVGATGFARKAEMWARTLARRPLADTGLVVVFVVADRVGDGHGMGQSMGNSVRKKVARAVRLNPGVASNRTAERMFVVDWQDWFPNRGELADDFLWLRAQRPTGLNGAWEVADLLDVLDVPSPDRMVDATAVIGNAAGLRSVPFQLRDVPHPPVHDLPLQRAGFEEVPHIQVDPRSGAPRDDVTRPRGSARKIKVPARLRF